MRMSPTSRLLVACPAILIAACGPSVGASGDSSGIAGGKPISIEEAPWQISLQRLPLGHFCAGSILSEEFVLTAQHCTGGFSSLLVVAGVDRLSDSDGGQRVSVA